MNLNKCKSKSLLAALFLVLTLSIAALVCLSFNNAFAAESEANVSGQQATDSQTINAGGYDVSFSFENAPAGMDSNFLLTTHHISHPYTLGQKYHFEFDKPLFYWSYIGGGSASVTFSEWESNEIDEELGFYVIAPAGYKVVDITPNEGDFTSDVDFVFTFAEYTGDYTLEINATVGEDEEGPALPGYHVDIYDQNWNKISGGDTNAEGFIKFVLNKDQANCYIQGSLEGYTDSITSATTNVYETDFVSKRRLEIYPIDTARTTFTSNDEFHDYFIYDYIMRRYNVPSYTPDRQYTRKAQLFLHDERMPGFEYKINDSDGAISVPLDIPEWDRSLDYNIIPVGKEGYTLNHWVLNRGHNAEEILYPGDTFVLAEDDLLMLEAVYSEAPAPSPTPGEETYSTAQTGDNTLEAVIPLAILVAACSCVFIARRKFIQQ